MKSITESLSVVFNFCANYPNTGHGAETSSPQVKMVIAALHNIGKLIQHELGVPGWESRVCKGAGAFPRIPWIVFCPKNSQAPKSGIYLCIAFSEIGNGLVCGVIAATEEKKLWASKLQIIDKSSGISINGKKPNTKYGDAFFNPKIIFKKNLDIDALIGHLKKSIVLHSKLTGSKIVTGKPFLSKFNRFNESLCSRLLTTSLLTKPFTILTGASGTGKTKLAESLAYHFRNHEDIKISSNIAIVPVGADWTDNRNVLGFVNHLRTVGTSDEEIPIYQSTAVLDLLLEASKLDNENTPHFLILDEMNLSHVERYFSDFLSAMEQKNGILPLHSEGPRSDASYHLSRFDGDEDGVPRELLYPENLYVIGTVNVDETTYMFSPKVLDRANVIEFKVEHEELKGFLEAPGNYPEIEKADDGQAEAFHILAIQAREGTLASLPKENRGDDKKVHDHVQQHLLNLFDIMQAGRFEFAYRTAGEVMRYMSVCRHLAIDQTEWDNGVWKSDLDDQILQKILPKLHGSIGRVGDLLTTLSSYCYKGKMPTKGDAIRLRDIPGLKAEDAAIPKSFTKLQAMICTLVDEQFVSFIQ